MDVIGKNELSGLIINLKNDIFAEIFQGNFRATASTERPDFVSPLLKFRIVRNTAFHRDRSKFGKTWRFAATAGIASFAMLNNLVGAQQSTYLADNCNVSAIPYNAELEVFVGIKSCWMDG